MTPVWKLNPAQVLGLAGIGVLIGLWLKRRLPLLDRLNIPVSIAGGMVFAVAALLLRDRFVNFEVDPTLRDLLQVVFMTTVGLGARVQLVRQGGVQVVWMLVIGSFGAVLQNVLGMGLAKVMGADPRLGILCGSVALTGGPATSIAFGGMFEKLGVQGATAAALASATFGITVAGLIGGYIGGWLIRRHQLGGGGQKAHETKSTLEVLQESRLLPAVIVIAVSIGIGNLLSLLIERTGVILPGYIGAMIAGSIIRNLDDRFRFARISQTEIDVIGRIALYLFIVMALLTLRLWELVHLALPMVVILAAQVGLAWFLCVWLSYRAMGRDYESAVMASGFGGFMLGTTANSVASMEELVEKYGPAPRAFLVVPIVGAFLIDFTNSLIITTMANLTSR